MNPRHLSQSAERYTPEYILAPGREILGEFDLDPASCEKANSIVKARHYYTAEDDGLSKPWEGRLLVNPPGTCKVPSEDGFSFPGCGRLTDNGTKRRTCSCRFVSRFWERLAEHVGDGRVTAALWIGFNPSQLQALQQHAVNPLHFVTCFIDHRVKYLGPDLKPLSSPPHNSYVSMVCRPGDRVEDDFASVYRRLGAITRRM